VTTLCQLPTFDDSDRMNTDMTFRSSTWYMNLERNLIDLSFHLATYPLPTRFLARLPNTIRAARLNHQRQYQHQYQSAHSQSEKCWWDAAEAEGGDEIIVPDPVTKISPMMGFTAQVEISNWSIRKYETACSAAQLLDLCLLYLTKQGRESEITADALSIASALYQCSNIIKITSARLAKLKGDCESKLSNMFSSLMDSDSDFARVNQINEAEKNVLETYRARFIAALKNFFIFHRKPSPLWPKMVHPLLVKVLPTF